jgi:hypothetical protein
MTSDATPPRRRPRIGLAGAGSVLLTIGALWLLLAQGAVPGTVLLVLGGSLLSLSLTSSSSRDVRSWSGQERRIAAVTVVGCVVAGVALYVLTR